MANSTLTSIKTGDTVGAQPKQTNFEEKVLGSSGERNWIESVELQACREDPQRLRIFGYQGHVTAGKVHHRGVLYGCAFLSLDLSILRCTNPSSVSIKPQSNRKRCL